MAVQLQITLPLDWASDFDRVAERWYFFHCPSGYCQYLLPKTGDEITRAAELVPRLTARPIHNAQSTIKTKEAMYISEDKRQSTVTSVLVQQTQPIAPVTAASQVLQRQVSAPQQNQQTPLGDGNTLQQNGLVSVPDSLRRASGSVARKPLRKPLPRQNSAPAQQQSQPPAAQRQDSQISPQNSISQAPIPENMVQSQQPLMMSPRSSMSGASMAEVQMHQAQQQPAASSWSSTSQTSVPNSLLQQGNPQSMYSPRSSISQNSILEAPLQRTVSEPISTNNTMQSPQQSYNSQYLSTTVQSPGITPIQEWTNTNVRPSQSASVGNQGISSWAEEFGESPRGSTSSRPKLANRANLLSNSAISLTKKSLEVSKKSYEASKGYVKAHPGKTTTIASGIVGGIGVVANACGADGLSEAVAASKVYLNVKRAQQRKRISHSVPHSTAQDTAATTAQSSASPPVVHGPSAQEVAHELFKMMQKQGQLPTLGQNPALQNNNNGQSPNQAAPSNPQVPTQQYFQPQYTQPQLVPQPLFVQPDPSSITQPFSFPATQLQPQTSDPSILSYQPPSSPTSSITSDPQALLTQCPTPPLSFSDPSSPLSLPINSLSITPDPSTLQYDQCLQDQTTTAIANQAILNSQAFTTSLTGQDMFVPGALTGLGDDPGAMSDGSAFGMGQGVTVDDYDGGSDGDGDDFSF
ncbi:hypothetical protein N431DRAFT_362830 [Stipitochalara longipes BDJ]|nr:hypothetical protein N431DRAFT_362830 [Stipitochalara longipes BDJ]